jgi:hypothetical protein
VAGRRASFVSENGEAPRGGATSARAGMGAAKTRVLRGPGFASPSFRIDPAEGASALTNLKHRRRERRRKLVYGPTSLLAALLAYRIDRRPRSR